MNSIPGLEHLEKEGWEIVRFGNASEGEWFVDSEGRVIPWGYPGGTDEKKIIVRKIEKPKTYRAFGNMEEAEPWFDEVLRWKNGSKAIFRVSAMGNSHVVIGFNQYTYQEAFSKFVNEDGTPFGVEVEQ